MNSIYDKTSNQAIIERINKLTPDSEALWGKMTVDQMLSHCIAPIDLALGNSKLKVNFIMQLLGKILKKKILNSNEFKKNSPTAPSFIRNNKYNFEDVKSELIQKFSTFLLCRECMHHLKIVGILWSLPKITNQLCYLYIYVPKTQKHKI